MREWEKRDNKEKTIFHWKQKKINKRVVVENDVKQKDLFVLLFFFTWEGIQPHTQHRHTVDPHNIHTILWIEPGGGERSKDVCVCRYLFSLTIFFPLPLLAFLTSLLLLVFLFNQFLPYFFCFWFLSWVACCCRHCSTTITSSSKNHWLLLWGRWWRWRRRLRVSCQVELAFYFFIFFLLLLCFKSDSNTHTHKSKDSVPFSISTLWRCRLGCQMNYIKPEKYHIRELKTIKNSFCAFFCVPRIRTVISTTTSSI